MSGAATGLGGLTGAPPNPGSPPLRASWSPVHPGVWRATIGTPEPLTPVAGRLVGPRVEGLERLPRVDSPPLPALEGRCTDRGCLLELPLGPDEQVYGLGLQLLSFAQRGGKRVTRVNADPRVDSGDTHAPVPFYVTTRGFGVLVDTARYATFYLGDARPRPAGAHTDGREPGAGPASPAGTPERITIEVPRAPGVDLYLFAGPQMLDAVRRYNLFSGGGAVPPGWALGLWYRVDAHSTAQSALAMMRELRERSIPCDVIGLEPGWQTHAYSCTFTWSPERFPAPAEFLREAGALGYRVNLWEHAFVHPASPLFDEISPYSGDLGVWGGLVPDFAGEPARRAFGEDHGRRLIEIGVSGFKLDECDNSDFTGGWSFPELTRFPSGVDGEQMHSLFGLRYQMAVWDAFRRRRRETFGLVRSSGALAAPYPFALYSDLYGHRDYIRALVNSGFAGLLWCPEVREASSEEDLVRRLETAVFSPLAQVDCWYMKNPPWRQLDRSRNNAGELLEDRERLESRCREIIGWRMRLVPYLAAAFERYAQDGTPPFRALVLDTPDDRRLRKVDDQFLVGDRMMVAPMIADETGSTAGAARPRADRGRTVVFPAGAWHDLWTGEAIEGGGEITVPATVERIPVYVRGGSILPWSDGGLNADSPEARRITALVFGDGSLPFTLGGGEDAQTLRWTGGRGQVEGRGRYEVYAWRRMG